MNTFVFLDLEETLIDDFHNGNILEVGVQRVLNFLNNCPQNTIIGLMSWAVWDLRDKDIFNDRFRPHLESLLNQKFDNRFIWSMDDWATQVFAHFNKKVSQEDLFDFFSKPEVLFSLARTHPDFHDSTIFLVDDAFEHLMTFDSPRNRCHVEIRNINNM